MKEHASHFFEASAEKRRQVRIQRSFCWEQHLSSISAESAQAYSFALFSTVDSATIRLPLPLRPSFLRRRCLSHRFATVVCDRQTRRHLHHHYPSNACSLGTCHSKIPPCCNQACSRPQTCCRSWLHSAHIDKRTWGGFRSKCSFCCSPRPYFFSTGGPCNGLHNSALVQGFRRTKL